MAWNDWSRAGFIKFIEKQIADLNNHEAAEFPLTGVEAEINRRAKQSAYTHVLEMLPTVEEFSQ